MTVCLRSLLAAAALAAIAGCAVVPGDPPVPGDAPVPAEWQAPLPHGGQLGALRVWWQQFDDPLLTELIDAAQTLSPTLASAGSRLAQARAARVAAGAALLPTLDATASASRGRQDLGLGPGTSSSIGLQAAWEIDLFGANQAARDAATLRLSGAQAGWHDARIAVAADVASSYAGLRACEAQLRQIRLDADSRAETARLTELAARAGFQPSASAALARASAAQGRSLVTQQRASCDLMVKSLVALTGIAEPALRAQLATRTAQQPQPAQLAVASVPAEALAQRPDLYQAAAEVIAANADVDQAEALRYPRIGLAGNIGAARFDAGPARLDGTVWSIGPVSVSLPIFDGGARRANVDAARARALEADALYRARLRDAVREVETALVSLQASADRQPDVVTAIEGFEQSLRATEERYRGGLGSLFDLEDARRSAVQAQIALIDLQRERVAAWIALYRALGGGWTRADTPVADADPRADRFATADPRPSAAPAGAPH